MKNGIVVIVNENNPKLIKKVQRYLTRIGVINASVTRKIEQENKKYKGRIQLPSNEVCSTLGLDENSQVRVMICDTEEKEAA